MYVYKRKKHIPISLHEGVWIWPVFFTSAGALSPTLNYDVTSSG